MQSAMVSDKGSVTMSVLLFITGMPGSGYEELLGRILANDERLRSYGWIHPAEDYSWSRFHIRLPQCARMYDCMIAAEKELNNRRSEYDAYAYMKYYDNIAQNSNIIMSCGYPNPAGLQYF